MCTVLLASATATTRLGRGWRSPITHGSALVAFERSKFALAPLIRSRRKYWLPRWDITPAGGILPWHQTQPGRELAPTAEAARFYHRGGDGSNDGANARNARQALTDGVALVPGHELLLDRRNRRSITSSAASAQKVYILHKKPSLSGTLCAKPAGRDS